ncbi:MAG TPA: hypothetical protein VFK89_01585 [Actinomycetota bacterium]|nr:hypothetical protein [Actinomycetota bacterium]
MKYEIENGSYVGTAEWAGPGEVALDMHDDSHRRWFEEFFASETSSMTGPLDCAEMSHERRNESEAAFHRAMFELAAHAYAVRAMGDGRRHQAHPDRTRTEA